MFNKELYKNWNGNPEVVFTVDDKVYVLTYKYKRSDLTPSKRWKHFYTVVVKEMEPLPEDDFFFTVKKTNETDGKEYGRRTHKKLLEYEKYAEAVINKEV